MKRIIYFLIAISITACMLPGTVLAGNTAEFFVATDGNDSNEGTFDSPFATIERAQEEVRKINKNMTGDITVYLRGGIYAPADTLSFDESDSGTNGYYVKYKAYNGEDVTITGGDKITGWQKYNDKIWKASYGTGDYMRQLSVNGNRARRAQTESPAHITALYNDEEDSTYEVDGVVVDGSQFASYKNKEDIQLHLGCGWKTYLFNVTGIEQAEDTSIFTLMQPDCNAAGTDTQHPLKADLNVTVENAFEELDTEGEFYYDRQEQTVYYMPRTGEDMSTADVRAARLEILLEVKGEKSINKVHNIEFAGIKFENATWQRAAESGIRIGQAQTISANVNDKKTDVPNTFIPACIQLQWAEKISFVDNTIKDMGAVGIGLYQGVNYCRFEGNTFADTADAAMTIGLPNQTYEDEVYEGYNLAADKPTTSSGETDAYPSSNVVDSNKRTLWTQTGTGGQSWVQIDLQDEYRIDRIDIIGRQDLDQPSTRANFEIQASNDPEFNDFVILASRGATPFEHMGTCSLYSNNDKEYRYVRIKKTDSQYFLLAEVRVINEDMPYSPVRESCKFNRIQNNYITRTSYMNWGAPSIQAYYVENIDISHNEVYNVPYSGICVGWGWTSYPDSTVCRDNKVMYNRVHRNNLINFDGGAYYSLGQQPNSIVKGNYFSEQANYISTLYSDNGSKYITVTDNVVEDVNKAYFLNDGTGYLTYRNNYSPHSGTVRSADHTSAEDPIRYVPSNPPMEALQIMKNAGIENKWEYVKDRAGEDMWPISTEMTYSNIRYDGIDDAQFRENYLKNFITDAMEWMKLVDVGTELGTYSQEGYNRFNDFLTEVFEETKEIDVDRDKVLQRRVEYEEELKKFEASKNTLPMDEMIKTAQNELNSTSVGDAIGNVSQKTHDELSALIEEAKNSNDEITRLILERGILDFRARKINLDITGFALDDQLDEPVID